MAKFILGYWDEDVDVTPNGENLTVYNTKDEAELNSEEWCEVEADTLEEARLKYEQAFEEWKQNQKTE